MTTLLCLAAIDARAERRLEQLGRGVVAVANGEGDVFISWRLLSTDVARTAFNLYRKTGDDVRRLLRTPEGYRPNDASVGDLDGDGEYEIVLHQVGRGRDNSQSGFTSEPILEAYRLDGAMLWRIDLGRNIREGAHYTQFMVYDLDGDGRAEVAGKTADGTIDGQGVVIGDANVDYRNDRGYVLDGPEFLTVFDGLTGAALATANYIPPRGNVRDWGDDYGNRVDRSLACVAYLDGTRPSLVMCRGYYARSFLAAWKVHQAEHHVESLCFLDHRVA